jgi:peptidoglycan/xylan/chitin deacetylase (PgdA/CDA1 family)
MAGFRNNFIKMISGVSDRIPISLLSRFHKQKLILPVYHLVSDEDVPHIKHLYAFKNIRAFKQDLDFLLKHYRPIDHVDIIQIIRGEKETNGRQCLLTFDDGLRSFYDVIAPILLEKGVPTINFLNSAFIDNRAIFYRYKASIILDAFYRLKAKGGLKTILSKIESELDISIVDFDHFLKSISYHDQFLLDQMAPFISVNFEEYLNEEKPYLTSNQIRELLQKGFYFGAHSHDHPEYRHLTLDKQYAQTKKSVDYIVSAFQLEYKLFAFPFTDYQVSAAFFKRINEVGLIDVSFGSAGMKRDTFANHLQRIPMELGHLTAAKIIPSEMIYYMCKRPFGKNRIRRI